ncbi:MAG: MFS transporter, partial [Treponema sp.]|nr:MFS transporter [Treponema sp.]
MAYATGVAAGLVQFALLAGLVEVRLEPLAEEFNVWKEIARCFKESFLFLKQARKAMLLMFTNSFVGALDILLLFFLQAKLPMAGIPNWALGIALLATQAGGVIGARLILCAKKFSYRAIFTIATAVILSAIALEHSGLYVLMALGGFMSSMADDALQVRTNTRLQNMFP